MKSLIKVFALFLFIAFFQQSAKAILAETPDAYTMSTLWIQNGKIEEKIVTVGAKVLNDNKIDKRVPFKTIRKLSIVNANSNLFDKTVSVYYGILPYLDNDSELAFVISHEIAHSIEAYGGFLKWSVMLVNSKEYEHKADLQAVDLMVGAGYNPIYAIIVMNKFFPEPQWDVPLFTTHPKTTKRMFEVYKYIYKKYPTYLTSSATNDVQYKNFERVAKRNIQVLEQKEREKALKKQKRL